MILPTTTPVPHPATEPAPPPERILLATDGEAAALAAARWVAAHAAHRPAVVTLAYLAGDLHRAGVLDPGPTLAEHVVWQEREYLNALLPAAALHTAVLEGPEERALKGAAQRADLLVLGSNRVGGRPALPVPSFSTRVASAPAVPTVVVPRDRAPGEGPVVVGVDESPDRVVTDFAAREALARRAVLVALHVVPGGEQDADADRRLAAVTAALRERHPGLAVRGELAHGRAAEQLAAAARGAALLVLGAHPLTPDTDALLGSAGRGVIAAPPCPVAVVPAGPR